MKKYYFNKYISEKGILKFLLLNNKQTTFFTRNKRKYNLRKINEFIYHLIIFKKKK
jgi:hypothetical protein